MKIEDAWAYVTRSDIHAISPSSGQFGTSVTITGVELLAGASNVTSITLAGVAVKSITSLSKTKIVVVADEADAAKTGDVVLTSTNGATVELTNGWKYVAPAEITGVNPEEGQIGTRVEIAGTGLLAGGSEVDSLTLAGADVQEILFANDTLIIVTAGANSTAETGTVTYVMDSKAAVEKAAMMPGPTSKRVRSILLSQTMASLRPKLSFLVPHFSVAAARLNLSRLPMHLPLSTTVLPTRRSL